MNNIQSKVICILILLLFNALNTELKAQEPIISDPYEEEILWMENDTLIQNEAPNNYEIKSDSLIKKQNTIVVDTVIHYDRLDNILSAFEKKNALYTKPFTVDDSLTHYFNKDAVTFSNELLYWLNWRRSEDSQITIQTYQDTAIVNPMFLTYVLKANALPQQPFAPLPDYTKQVNPYDKYFAVDSTFLQREFINEAIRDSAYSYLEYHNPSLINYTKKDFDVEIVKTHTVHKEKSEDEVLIAESDDPLAKIFFNKTIPKRRYWTTKLESAIQLTQNYISPNWHKSGTSNIQFYSRQYFVFSYIKNKISLLNEIEWKTSLATTPKDTVRAYNISQDNLRLRSLIGHQAFGNWKYTIDITFQTPLFSSFKINSHTKNSSFLSKYTLNAGVGMTYTYRKSYKKGRNLDITITMSPLSYGLVGSINRKILAKDIHSFGSDIQATLNSRLCKNVRVYSRFRYNTNYHKVFAEMDNIFTFTINRFLATTLTLNLRFDDQKPKMDDFKTHLQINECLSIGFAYKI